MARGTVAGSRLHCNLGMLVWESCAIKRAFATNLLNPPDDGGFLCLNCFVGHKKSTALVLVARNMNSVLYEKEPLVGRVREPHECEPRPAKN